MTTDGYPRKRQRTRRRLIEAGMVVLARSGPDGARVADIAAEAGFSPGTFYNHFPSLAELTDAVCGQLSTGVEIGETTLAAIENDPAARVAVGTLQLLRLAENDPTSAAAFVSLLASVPPFRARIRHVVAGAVADGVRAGRFRPAPVEIVADACLGSVVQWIRTALADEADGSSHRDRLDVILRLVGLHVDEIDRVVERSLSSADADADPAL